MFRKPALSALIIALAMVFQCPAQVQPRQLGIDITRATSLSDDQKQQIDLYATYWCGILTDPASTSQQVENARRELLRPLVAAIQPTSVFRFEFSSVVVPPLETLLQKPGQDQPHATINAALVLGELASRLSLRLLIRHSDNRNETRRTVRIQTAMNAAKMLIKYGNDPNVLKPREISSALRSLRNAAQREEDDVVLRHQLEGILAINTPDSRDALIEVLSSVIDKIRAHNAEGVSPLIKPLYESVNALRNALLGNLPQAEINRIASELGPVLGKFLDTASEKWDNAHVNPEVTKQTAGPIRACEALLKRIVANQANPPTTTLRQHWESGNKQQFIIEVGQWSAVLRRPPFSR